MLPLSLKPKSVIQKLALNKNKEIIAVAILVPAIGVKRTYDEYKKADEKDKKNLLIRNSSIMLSTLAGAFWGKHLESKAAKSIEKLAQGKYIKKMGLTFLQNASIPFFGMVTGFIAGQIVEKLVPPVQKKDILQVHKQESKLASNSDEIIQTTPSSFLQGILLKKNSTKVFNKVTNDYIEQLIKTNPNMLKEIDPGTLGKVYSYAGIGLGSTFDTVYSSLSGYSVGTAPTFKGKVKKVIQEILSGVVVPVAVAVPVSISLNKALNGKHKVIATLLKAGILIPIATISTAIGSKLAGKINEKF